MMAMFLVLLSEVQSWLRWLSPKFRCPVCSYGPFLASVDEIGQVDDTGVVMYGVSFTPSTVVGKPTQRFAR